MAEKPDTEFGARKPAAIRPAQPVKRGQVALLLMGTLAVGGGAYAMMPSENCNPNRPGIAAPSGQATNTECRPRSSSVQQAAHPAGAAAFTAAVLQAHAASGTSPSDSGSSHVARGGFGSFASHFTGGG